MQVKLLAKDIREQLEVTHQVLEVVDQSHRKIFAALQCGEARDFICSVAIVMKKTGRKKNQPNCLCELLT